MTKNIKKKIYENKMLDIFNVIKIRNENINEDIDTIIKNIYFKDNNLFSLYIYQKIYSETKKKNLNTEKLLKLIKNVINNIIDNEFEKFNYTKNFSDINNFINKFYDFLQNLNNELLYFNKEYNSKKIKNTIYEIAYNFLCKKLVFYDNYNMFDNILQIFLLNNDENALNIVKVFKNLKDKSNLNTNFLTNSINACLNKELRICGGILTASYKKIGEKK